MFGVATYAYDENDNLTHVHVTGGSQIRDQDYCYDEHNRLTNVMTGGCEGGISVIGLGYDVQGNLANKNGATFTFDYGNRLRAASAGNESYAYDAQGRRIRSSSDAGQIDSLYSQSGQLLFQKDGRSNKRRQYVYLGGSLVAEVDLPLTGSSATVSYQHTDALGTPVAITNSSKTVTERRDYEPYGYQITPTLKDGPNYTGHVADAATGMIYMQQRYYDPEFGRFVSTDAVAVDTVTGRNFCRYCYGANNPYKFKDLDGRDISYASKAVEEQVQKIIAEGGIGSEMIGKLDAAPRDFVFREEDRPSGAYLRQSHVDWDDRDAAQRRPDGKPGSGSGGQIFIRLRTESVNTVGPDGKMHVTVEPVKDKIIHEVSHAIDGANGTLPANVNEREDKARSDENAYRQEHGDDQRRATTAEEEAK